MSMEKQKQGQRNIYIIKYIYKEKLFFNIFPNKKQIGVDYE